ncbi:hypothetical protein EH228_02840 [Erwinia endophytica]|uniref:hypothetical protein n=1 Tax=Erwinia endophytica TaxID=1563158 RepID=UPI001265D977|nr:hypothetical protein [Erwinia endophytica]KAB8313099.1 hypothetical protein EH228_02840 [Erwinia endophytica]
MSTPVRLRQTTEFYPSSMVGNVMAEPRLSELLSIKSDPDRVSVLKITGFPQLMAHWVLYEVITQ